MNQYRVRITATALAAIQAHAEYIAMEQHAPRTAQRWLERVYDAVGSLRTIPHRAQFAEENQYLPYDVRRLVIHRHLLLFTIDEVRNTVYVIGFRHGHSLPRIEELPDVEGGWREGEE